MEVWLESRKLVLTTYLLTKKFPDSEQYTLTSQLRRCAISVPSNIAEGIRRQHQKEKVHFMHIARGSLFELETQAYLSSDLKYITNEKLNSLLEHILLCKKLINGFIRFLNK